MGRAEGYRGLHTHRDTMGVYGAPPVRAHCVRVWGVRMAWDTRVSGGVHMPGHACSCVWGVMVCVRGCTRCGT